MDCDFCGDPIPEGTGTELMIKVQGREVSQVVCDECSLYFDPGFDVREAADKLFKRVLGVTNGSSGDQGVENKDPENVS